ncbi:DNA polymerase III subunit beta [Gammaproteobacteria bacterium LSUCC0057]|uniref:Beta sliding clamp n=1 Tax=Gammaproteobacteria bacterium LSUCC0057 TaxID=2559237 RepID=A0A4Y8UGM2_9GAMM|nr:DNA polymerase III subunit beta [Gammaproteobacteria bacterium LSUCC0057]
MKFSLEREALLKPLQMVVGVVERRQTLPILSNVLLTLRDGRLSVTATDLEVEIVGYAAVSGELEEGEVTIPARKFVDICRSLPDRAMVSFASADGRAQVKSGRSRFTLSTLPANEFPSVDSGDSSATVAIASAALKKLIEATAFAMAQQDVRYYLNGMLWELTADNLRVVATDGHRMALADHPCESSVAETSKSILPRKGVVELSRLLGDDEQIEIQLGGNHLRIATPGFQFISKLVDGAYPDYQRVLPKGGDKIIEGDRAELKQAFSRTAILSNEKYRGIKLNLVAGQLLLTANNPEQEQAEEEVAVDYSGEELELGFNVSYLIDVVNALKGEKIRLTLVDANSSALIEDPQQGSALYVVMPMRL